MYCISLHQSLITFTTNAIPNICHVFHCYNIFKTSLGTIHIICSCNFDLHVITFANQNVKRHQEGPYECVISNNVGEDSLSVQLDVECK